SWIGAGAPVGPEREEKIAVFVQRYAANHVAQSSAVEDRKQNAGESEAAIKEAAPDSTLQMHAQLNPNAAQNEEPQNDHQRKIEAAETGSVKQWKGEVQSSAAGDQPDFIAVPYRANGAKHGLPLLISSGDEQMQDTGAEIKAVENDIRGNHDRNEPKPYEKHSSNSPTLP